MEGLTIIPAVAKARGMTEEALVREALQRRQSAKGAAKEIGVSYNTFRLWLKRNRLVVKKQLVIDLVNSDTQS